MGTDISDWAGTGACVGTEVGAIVVVNAHTDTNIDVEVNLYIDAVCHRHQYV